MRLQLAALLAAASLSVQAGSLLPAMSWAAVAPPAPEIAQADSQIQSGDFEEAVRTLQRGLAQPDLTDDQLVEFYRLLGLAELYLGDETKARDAYEKLLQARPDYRLPASAPPKLHHLYDRIVEDIRRRRVQPVVLTAEALKDTPGNEPLVIDAQIEHLPLGARAKLYLRRAGAQTFSAVDFARKKSAPDAFEAVVPAFEVPSEARPYDVEYYFEVADAAQRRLAGKGDAFSPLSFKVMGQPGRTAASTESDAWYSKPWVWAIAGAVAVGTGVGIYFIATQHPTGTVTIRIQN